MYEFHVGDYVETIKGEVGYLSEFSISDDHLYGRVKIKDCDDYWTYALFFDQFPDYFRRIGAYEFSRKIKPLTCGVAEDHKIIGKINEIINWINKGVI